MKRITSTDLTNWAPTRSCQEHLPLLIRKLIRASNVEVLNLLIPSGDNVILPGFDGTVEVTTGTEYIPSGKSVWEIGSDKAIGEKANEEFNKRTNNIEDSEIAEKAFVFVTPRVWTKKTYWLKKKKELCKWKDVQVIDGQVLEEWIEQQPSVGFWLAKFLEHPLGNVLALDQYWQEWSTGISNSIPSSMVVFGRENETAHLARFLNGKPNRLIIKAPTADEAVAFVAASVEKMGDKLKETIFSKAIIVKSEEDFRSLVPSKSSMILIARFEVGSIANQAVKNNHYVIIPIGNNITATKADIQLPRIRRKGFEEGLKEMGYNHEVAEAHIRNSGQSLSVLRRRLNFEINQQPVWALNRNQIEILPALLIGTWNEEKEADKTVVSLVANEEYEIYKAKLLRWKIDKDAPVIEIRSVWRLTSVLDTWSILFQFITKSHLDNLRTVFLIVLPEISPELELEPDKRYLASFFGKIPKFSYAIKEGLCQSLIMIAVFGEEFNFNSIGSPQGFVDEVIHKLLFQASGDTWCTLSDFLPLIAEASPREFLQAIDFSLNQDTLPIMEMFGDVGDFFTTKSYYTHLLWALENLLFSPDFFLKTVLILGQLSRLDPGGKLANRPINSLVAVFTPWFRQTEVDIEGKKIALQKLIEKEPVVAWELLLKLMPNGHGHTSPIHTCKWRFNTQYLQREVSNYDVYIFNSFIFRNLLDLAKENEQKVSQLVDFYEHINLEDRKFFLEYLKEAKNKIEHSEHLVWSELRDLIARHKRHEQQQWALAKTELGILEEVLKLYEPNVLSKRYQHLFESGRIDFPEGKSRKEMSTEERNNYFNKLREDAFEEIYNASGLTEIFELVSKLTHVHYIAHAASRVVVDKEDERKILNLLGKDDNDKLCLFAKQFIYSKYSLFKKDWIEETWNFLNHHYEDEKLLIAFFLSLPPRRDVWNLLETTSGKITKTYWQNVSMPNWSSDLSDNLYLIQNLQSVNRHISVMQVLAYLFNDISTELLCEGLQNMMTIKSDEEVKIDPYHIGVVFNELYYRNDINEEKIVQLELYYLIVLTDRYNESRPKYLHQKLTSNPDFFVEIVSYVHLPDKETVSERFSEEELKQWFERRTAYKELLESWRKIPGVKEDDTIDEKILNNWITKVRDKAKEYKILKGVDAEMGSLLATFPRNDTSWPPNVICEILDSLNSKTMLSHFSTEIFNSRGTYMKSAYEGGEQERSLANYFAKMGKRIILQYPLTADVLLKLSENYKRASKDEDDDAYLDELR